MKTYLVNSSAVAIIAAAILTVSTPGALAAGFVCPSGGTPAPGSKVHGGLEVSPGLCVVNGVTVDGGITVDTGGHLQLQGSTANGGVRVQPGGELDINARSRSGSQPEPVIAS